MQLTKEYLKAKIQQMAADMDNFKPESREVFEKIRTKIEEAEANRFRYGKYPITFDELFWLICTSTERDLLNLRRNMIEGIAKQ